MNFGIVFRDNLNAFGFNMLVVTILDVVVFLALFVMTMPLPDLLKRGYAKLVYRYTLPFAFFMMFCMYNLFTTVFKLLRTITNYHMSHSEGKRIEPRMFYKRIAKNQRDIVICIVGCIFSYLLLILAAQFKKMTTDIVEKVEDKPANEKKNDYYVC